MHVFFKLSSITVFFIVNLLSPLSEDAVNAFRLAVILGFHLERKTEE